jgi:hypothetical protein
MQALTYLVRDHDGLEDVFMAGGADFVFTIFHVTGSELEVFPFQTAEVSRLNRVTGNFTGLIVEGSFGLDGTLFPD